jgi:uncharacterized membrane protein
MTSIFSAYAIAMLLTGPGCTSDPATQSATSEQELMTELDRRYAAGAISKEQYERERAEIRARAQREGIQSGSPMNETIRGFGR